MTKRERDVEDETTDRRLRPAHKFRDIGPAIADADYRPRISGNPEQTLAVAFIKMKRDYGGTLPADFMLHAVLTPAGNRATVSPQHRSNSRG